MSTLSLHSLQMSSCTLRRHIAHWGGQSQNYKNSQVSIHIVGTLAEEGVCRQKMRIERSEHVGKVHWANIMFPVPQNRRYKNSKGFLLTCVQRRQHEDGTFDCDIWFRLLFEPPCDSLWTARCWLFPNLKATASKSERLLRITTGREYAARYALGWSLTTCLGSA